MTSILSRPQCVNMVILSGSLFAGATILVLCHIALSLQIIGRLGTGRFNLRVISSTGDFIYGQISSTGAQSANGLH